jgi:HAMP domain-containing protein/signal transduction histidine kinase/DNA-binding response OmpR family regulator
MVMENIRPAKRRASKSASPSLKSVPPSEIPAGTPTPKFEDRELHELLYALQALRAGDFSARMASNHIGIFGKLADCFNDIAAANQRVAHELNLVGEVVGQQGRTRHRADMGRSDGAWGQMQRSVNGLVDDLLWPTAEVTRAISAVAQGDLLQTVSLDVDGRPLKGEFLRAATIVNTMIKQLGIFTSEVTRVAREVGTEGKLGGQAEVPEVTGVWKDLTENVNSMASNLTAQVRNIADVTIAVANGDLSKKITVDVRGEILQLKEAINTMVDQLRSFASEVTRVAREVGTDGKLGGQAIVPGVAGTWKDLTDSVNAMCGNLTDQVRSIAAVTTAVARGDLSRTITVDVRGEILELKDTINTMVDQLNSFASEVTRVAREVGTEGKLGGQATVPGVAGTWKDLTDNVNFMASNLTAQVRNIAEVSTAIAGGDLSKKITVNVSGEILQLKETINTMVDQLNAFAGEVTRVAREVGTEGRLGGQANVRGVAGTWKDLTDSVNSMASNLTAQVRAIAAVSTAIAGGDLSKKITVDVKGEILELKETINTTVDQLNAFASEVTRVAREVGVEGRLGGQAVVLGVAGTWKDLTDSVNSMASNLTGQVRNIAEVATAVAQGNLSKKITVTVSGEILELKETINTMVDQLNAFAAEVTRVAREVGTDGKLGGQAQVPGVAGTWKDLTDSVNSMAGNLTAQVRNIAEVATAIAGGDLSRKITVDVRGEILQLKETLNTMVDQLNRFASEVTRMAREVGTEGRLGGQANVPGVAGTWKDLTDNVNLLAANLTTQVRNIAEVTTAVAQGDLSRKITVDVKGEILELKNTFNTMLDQLNSFSSEVTRVAREVGTEGKLGGQAQVPGVAGTWKDLTDNVNFMASNLTAQVRNIADVATAIASGDLSKKITVDVRGEILFLKETLNTMVEQLRSFAAEVTRVAREVGTDGRLGGQAVVPGVGGTWKDLTDNVNLLAANLTTQVRNIAEVTTAVASGDLSRKITVDVKGEILELKNTINTMVDQLNAFASEVTRVAREVGTEGKLGGQAEVPGVGGTWKALTDTVNVMAANLTEQVRGIVRVVTAVANGDLTKNLAVKSKGEVAALADTINNMTETLAIFADQVTSVAREVGVEGRLGGQANVPGTAGTWKDLTGNVNLLAANLTTQVRAIAEVATAVTKGDLTRSIQVDARGEVAELKDNINTMIGNLRLTTERNTEQDWLKSNLAKITNMLQGQRDLETVGRLLLAELSPLVNAQTGVIYRMTDEHPHEMVLLSSYADDRTNGYERRVRVGQGLIGQAASDKRRILVTDVATDTVPIGSALFKTLPHNIIILPVLFENKLKAVFELASIRSFTSLQIAFLEQLTASIGIVLNSIEATMQTESLLTQSQTLAAELQTQQGELQQTNEQLGQKAQQLAERNVEVERKNEEIEQARRELEEKAYELALTSKYKSEFLANMSHELRTPLNSILILGQQLAENPDGNLAPRQIEFARTIYGAGTDLLNLISDILDLSKIESGTVSVDAEDIVISDLVDIVARPFRHEAESRKLAFTADIQPDTPQVVVTDSKRLQQVLKNLLSNAFKFTLEGEIRLRIGKANEGWSQNHTTLNASASVVVFEVKDSGIGIPVEKQKIIFEAFQQADASTSRKFGGTGLGLAISRELATLLGGEIQLRSTPGEGSTFSLYLPQEYVGVESASLGAERQPVTSHHRLAPRVAIAPREVETLEDDRLTIAAGDKVLMIVEDDPLFAKLMLDNAHQLGLKALVVTRGSDALDMARQYRPTAISLDIFLPDMLGWTVLSQLKQNSLTRHIPVQVTTMDDNPQYALAGGAYSFFSKSGGSEELAARLAGLMEFANLGRKRLLVVEDSPAEASAVSELLGGGDIDIMLAATGEEALALMKSEPFHCVVLDLSLPDMTGFDVLQTMNADDNLQQVPVVVFTGRELTPEEDRGLNAVARGIVVKGVESSERLLYQTSLFLHRDAEALSPAKRKLIERLSESDSDLVGRTALLVDDDARNIFALSSVLERRGMQVLSATTGKEALEIIQSHPSIAIVLMDIMMPDMDGYETIAAIRSELKLGRLPIIALTAKAMKGDREKCLLAGASEYLAKPVNTEQLLESLRMWLHR